jgi:hypothetical protein
MSKTITYVITYENGRWVSRCDVAGLVAEYHREKELAEAHARRAAELAVTAAKALTSHWSEPDTARVVGLSKQRVHQLKVSA